MTILEIKKVVKPHHQATQLSQLHNVHMHIPSYLHTYILCTRNYVHSYIYPMYIVTRYTLCSYVIPGPSMGKPVMGSNLERNRERTEGGGCILYRIRA